MIKFLHTADWHRGFPGEPSVYQQKTLPAICDMAHENKCRYVLVAGDIFDKPKPDQQVKDLLLRQLLDFGTKTGLSFILTVGNHDYTTKAHEYHSLTYLHYVHEATDAQLPVYVVEPGQLLELGELAVYCMKGFDDIPNVGTNLPLVLAWHGTVPGYSFTKELDAVPVAKAVQNILKKSKAKYLALGDIHKTIRLTNECWYPGPPVQKTYSDQSSVLVVSIDEKVNVEVKDLPLPKRITFDIEYSQDKTTEEDIVTFVKENAPAGNFIRLKFELPLSVWSAINHNYIKEHLKEYCVDLKLDNNPVQEIRTRKDLEKVAKAKTVQEELDIIIEENDFGIDKNQLKKFCSKYL